MCVHRSVCVHVCICMYACMCVGVYVCVCVLYISAHCVVVVLVETYVPVQSPPSGYCSGMERTVILC